MSQAVNRLKLSWQELVVETVAQVGILDELREKQIIEAFLKVDPTTFFGEINLEKFVNLPHELGFGMRCYPFSLLVRFLSLVDIKRRSRVLCMGCGSGYLAAVVSTIGSQTFGVESVGPLIQQARKNLDLKGYSNVVVHRGDPFKGWSEQGPFDVILVERPLDQLPIELIDQLSNQEGILISVINDGENWRLMQCVRDDLGIKWTKFEVINVLSVGKEL